MRDTGKRPRPSRKRLLFVGRGLAVVVLFAVAFAVWPRAEAQARAAVVLVSVLQPPGLTQVVGVLTGEPRVEEIRISGNPTSVFRPAGGGPHPVIVFANGAIPEGRSFAGVRDLADGFARAGFTVVVPDLPGLMTDTITTDTVAETVAVAREASEKDYTRDGRVGLVGVSTGGTLALLAAEDPRLEGRVSAVTAVAPYTDIRTILAIATTGRFRLDSRMVPYRSDPLLSYVVARSVISALPPTEDQRTLLRELDGVWRHDPDPLAGLRGRPTDDLGPEARSVVALLANRDPERFDALYRGLAPEIKSDLKKLSPVAGAGRLRVPVELVTGPEDKYFPPSESHRLRRIAPDRVVTVTGVLDHSQVRVSLRTLPDFIELNGFAVRSLLNLGGEREG